MKLTKEKELISLAPLAIHSLLLIRGWTDGKIRLYLLDIQLYALRMAGQRVGVSKEEEKKGKAKGSYVRIR